MKRRVARIMSALLVVNFSAGGSINAQAQGPQAHGPAPAQELHVDGKHLKDNDGRIVRLQGIHVTPTSYFVMEGKRFLNGDHQGCLQYFKELVDVMTDPKPRYGANHGWYGNQLRIDSAIPSWKPSPTSSDMDAMVNVTDNVLVPLAKYANTKGLYLIIFPSVDVSTDSTTPELQKKLLEYWDYWSSHPGLKNAANVQFEIVNEPIKAQAADSSWGSNQQKYTDALVGWLQPVVDKIRSNGARNVIWIPGLEWQSDYAGFANNPVKGENIGYAVHFYPAYGNVGNDHAKILAFWQNNIEPVATKYPINITETAWIKNLPGDNDYWKLFNGVTGDDKSGFGTGLHRILSGNRNVSWAMHLPGFVFAGGDPQGKLYHEPARDNMAPAAFKWFYEFRNDPAK